MLANLLFWLGLLSFMCSIMVGLALLDQDSSESPPFLRNIMFAIGIAVFIYIFIFNLGEPEPAMVEGFGSNTRVLPVAAIVLGAVAGLLLAFAADGNKRTAVVAGGLAGITMFLMRKNLPYESSRLIGWNDVLTLISILATMLVGGLTYYLLRHWGENEEKWD